MEIRLPRAAERCKRCQNSHQISTRRGTCVNDMLHNQLITNIVEHVDFVDLDLDSVADDGLGKDNMDEDSHLTRSTSAASMPTPPPAPGLHGRPQTPATALPTDPDGRPVPPWYEDDQGTALPYLRVQAMRETGARYWNVINERKMVAPRSYTNMPLDLHHGFIDELRKHFPELRLCGNNHKASGLASETYTTFLKRWKRGSQPIAARPENVVKCEPDAMTKGQDLKRKAEDAPVISSPSPPKRQALDPQQPPTPSSTPKPVLKPRLLEVSPFKTAKCFVTFGRLLTPLRGDRRPICTYCRSQPH